MELLLFVSSSSGLSEGTLLLIVLIRKIVLFDHFLRLLAYMAFDTKDWKDNVQVLNV